MDRFIEEITKIFPNKQVRLKSNMDRFIVLSLSSLLTPDNSLKSNMDRFIACKYCWY